MKKQMLLEAEIWTVARTDRGNAVLVRPLNSEHVVPIFIGQLEAQSILIGLGNVEMPRPLTHDLFGKLLIDIEAKLLRVEIVDMHEGTFFSNLIIQQDKKEVAIDARPSDAISLAVRAACPVFIAEHIVEEAGVSTSLIVEENPHMQNPDEPFPDGDIDVAGELEEHDVDEPPPFEPTLIERLQMKLEEAVDTENYEEAARIRDRIEALR